VRLNYLRQTLAKLGTEITSLLSKKAVDYKCKLQGKSFFCNFGLIKYTAQNLMEIEDVKNGWMENRLKRKRVRKEERN